MTDARGGAIVVEPDLLVRARDGVGLATDVYRPAHGGPFPVLLERTPYDKSAPSRAERTAAVPTPRSRAEVAAYFVAPRLHRRLPGLPRPLQIGRAFHQISERGRGRLRHARLARAPTLVQRPGRHLWPVLRGAYPGGARLSRPAGIGGAVSRLRRVLERLPQRHPPRWRLRSEAGDLGLQQRARRCEGPGHKGGARGAGHQGVARPPAVAQGQFAAQRSTRLRRLPVRTVGARRTSTNSGNSPGSMPKATGSKYADVPVTHLSGWYDPYARTAVENYAGLSKRGRAPNRLILGPWTHGDRSLTYAGDVDFGAAAAVDGNLADDFFGLRRAWFDRWVKGVDNGVDGEPPVQVFVMGGGSGRRNAAGRLDHGGRWRSAAAWPLPQTQWTPFYLHPDRSLGPAKPEASPPLAFRFDPHRPGADDRRRLELGRAGHARRRLRPARGAARLRRARTLSAALPNARTCCRSPPRRSTGKSRSSGR